MKKYVDNQPKPVEKIELNESHLKLRVILFILCFCVVVVCAILIFVGLSKEKEGWTEIEANPTVEINCSEDFVLSYDLGNTKDSSTEESRKISKIYTERLEQAYMLFNTYKEYNDIYNVYYINNNYNKDIVIEPLLYEALEKVAGFNSNVIYLGPIYNYYEGLISSYSHDEAKLLDPYQNESIKAYFNVIISYINNEDIKVDFLGNNTIKLIISDDYLNFAKENEITNFIDFAWLKNSFIIDYVASGLIEEGYINGSIATYDGYFKNLDTKSEYNYLINIIDNPSNDNPTIVGKYATRGSVSTVQFRSFMYYESDVNNRYYQMADKTYRHLYVDEKDGLCKSSIDSLTCYSNVLSCSDMALKAMHTFINDSFVFEELNVDDINYIWVDDNKVYYTDDIKLEELNSSYIGELKW